ncbi:MAG TPA: DUF5679 domain-containing protein [Nitrososphaera sp.]
MQIFSLRNHFLAKFTVVFKSKARKSAFLELFLYPRALDPSTLATQGYCVKCKAPREMAGEKQVVMKNGRNATTGTCTVCGTKMFKIGGGGGGSKVKAKAKAKPKKAAKKAKKTKGKKKK